jgi:phosphoglycolate phosphatase
MLQRLTRSLPLCQNRRGFSWPPQFILSKKLSTENFDGEDDKPPPITVIFDLDGTLVDVIPSLRDAIKELFKTEGFELSIDNSSFLASYGEGFPELIRKNLPVSVAVEKSTDHINKMADRLSDLYVRQFSQNARLYPNVEKVLEELHEEGHSCLVCTNFPHRVAIDVLNKVKINKFISSVVGGDSLRVRKPDPGPLLQLLALNGDDTSDGEPRRIVMVGDDEIDAKCAHAAQIPLIAVSYGYRRGSMEGLHAEHIIDDISELSDAITHLMDKSMY